MENQDAIKVMQIGRVCRTFDVFFTRFDVFCVDNWDIFVGMVAYWEGVNWIGAAPYLVLGWVHGVFRLPRSFPSSSGGGGKEKERDTKGYST
jgi:hypothetical protein